ncbi:MAG: DNA repair protein RecO [Pseudomonadota bacterium]
MHGWRDEAIILTVAKHGENGAVARLLSHDHGLYGGYVRGGASRRRRGDLQPGNGVVAGWQARTLEQLGHFELEVKAPRAALAMTDADRLAGLAALVAITATALPERIAYPRVQAGLAAALDLVIAPEVAMAAWTAGIVRYELGLLAELGFGLRLEKCAATGAGEDLVYVSPKSGQAVSRTAGAPYADRLLTLPGFLGPAAGSAPAGRDALLAGLALTGHFLAAHILHPKAAAFPKARLRFIDRLRRQGGVI